MRIRNVQSNERYRAYLVANKSKIIVSDDLGKFPLERDKRAENPAA